MAERKRTRAQRRRDREARASGTPVPDPIEGATPYVDQAKMAAGHRPETDDSQSAGGPGVDVPSPDVDEPEGEVYADELSDAGGDPRDVEAAPDQLEGDFAPGREHVIAGAPTARRRGRFITFLGHCVDELRRVQWPDRRQVGQGTAVTLGFVVLAGGYLGLMDAIWKPLIEAIL